MAKAQCGLCGATDHTDRGHAGAATRAAARARAGWEVLTAALDAPLPAAKRTLPLPFKPPKAPRRAPPVQLELGLDLGHPAPGATDP
jgi:hypothetical protein